MVPKSKDNGFHRAPGLLLSDPDGHPELFLAAGLHLAGFSRKILSRRTQLRRFRELYGCDPQVVRAVWKDLRPTMEEGTKVEYIFWALYFLRNYPKDGDLATRWSKDPATIRKWIWTIIFGLADLGAQKIRFPPNGFNLVFILSVDGTDCPIEEPRPWSKTWFSQKFKGAGVKYEVALDVLTGNCV